MTDTKPIIFTFEHTIPAMSEGMVLAGNALRMGLWRRGISIVVSLVLGALMALGGAATFVLLVQALGSNQLGLAVVGGALLGFGVFFLWYNFLIRMMAKAVLAAPFNAGPQEMIFDPEGATLKNQHAEWRTDWFGVHKVQAGKLGLHVFLSGISLTVPGDVIGEHDTIKELAAALEGWRIAAT